MNIGFQLQTGLGRHGYLLRRLSQELTPPELYILRFYMEAFFTPIDFEPFFKKKSQFSAEARDWLTELEGFLHYGHPNLQSFRPKEKFPGVDFYQALDSGKKSRGLVIAFAGFYLPLGIPTAVFLQMIASRKYDLLLLNDCSMLGFANGIPGYARQFDALIAKLRTDFAIERYQDIRICGMSRGGYASLRAALVLPVNRALSVGGAYPISQKGPTYLVDSLITGKLDRLRQRDLSWISPWRKLQLWRHLIQKSASNRLLNAPNVSHNFEQDSFAQIRGNHSIMSNAYGAGFEFDVRGNEALNQQFLNLQSIPIAGVDAHNLAYVLLKQKRLNSFLENYLFA